jgi:hypothetical protein
MFQILLANAGGKGSTAILLRLFWVYQIQGCLIGVPPEKSSCRQKKQTVQGCEGLRKMEGQSTIQVRNQERNGLVPLIQAQHLLHINITMGRVVLP